MDVDGKSRAEILLAEDVDAALSDLRAATPSCDLPILSIVTIRKDVTIGPFALERLRILYSSLNCPHDCRTTVKDDEPAETQRKAKFQRGHIVHLNSGSPDLRVTRVIDEPTIEAEWIDDQGKTQRDTFSQAAVTLPIAQ